MSYTILLNGREHGFIRPERGIRQGDPMSPFLFIMCAEALVSVLNNAEHKGHLHGIQLAAGGPSVHHLLFADDSLLLCQANLMESVEVLRCLKLYGQASGQQINPSKSSIIFGDRVEEGIKADIKRIISMDNEGGEGTYLGLPEVFKGSKKNILNFIREKLHNRIQGWFVKSLSLGGKEILIKSVGLALPVYAMSVFKLPKYLCAKLTSALRDFWWGDGSARRKLPWVAWEKLCQSKENGGMGFHDIERFNQALLGKQAWRIHTNLDSLVSRVLKSRYFRNGSFQEASIGTRSSYAWRSILHGREVMNLGLVKQIGDGKESNVWSTNWLLDTSARPPMYMQDSIVDLTLKVSDLFIPNTDLWDKEKVRDTFTPEDAERVLKLKPLLSRPDSDVWGLTNHMGYTTQSAYQLLSAVHDQNNPTHTSLPPVEQQLWKNLWKKRNSELGNFKTFPWILWNLWKSRNELVFENSRTSPLSCVTKSVEEANIWFQVNGDSGDPVQTPAQPPPTSHQWERPPQDFLKCNIGSAWDHRYGLSGAGWLVRDHQGIAINHSRRAFVGSMSKREADLKSLHWAVESMVNMRLNNVILEASSIELRESLLEPHRFPELQSLIANILLLLSRLVSLSLLHVQESRNRVSNAIAVSVTADLRTQSYVAAGGPSWLSHTILSEAQAM
ncbi:uncharacterized protein LOC125582961 [Brassica napus]|uniref:uncharacterized protein LOC125582961 n=1 Tax=Brassica napus TaxID=3708 RepID=UPI002078BB93|nr:uncharacterized protein LOC125582961 [Brassica napus]